MSKYDYCIQGWCFDEGIGLFDIVAETEIEGLFFQWRNYTKTAFTREHGRFANWCETGQIEFYKGPDRKSVV